MDLSEFDFELPEELIALRPVRPRPASRLLVAQGAGETGRAPVDAHVHDLPDWLRPGDCLVLNDTRVIPARLFGTRDRGTPPRSDARDAPAPEGVAQVEVTLAHRIDPARWEVLARPAKRLAPGDTIRFGEGAGVLSARVEAREGPAVRLAFDREGPALDAAIAAAGVMPLPPYIARRRPADAQDLEDYQPVFARHEGAVASPTASLHFDEALLERLRDRGVRLVWITLHVGPGTFLPVTAERIEDHRMHAEAGSVSPEAAGEIAAARAAGGRVVAVGTTVLRLLESAVDEAGRVRPFEGETALFIRPGHRLRAADGLMTNFHLPRSTLFMLVAAVMGLERMRALYAHAVAQGYRFYSYGDSSLLLPRAD